MGWIFGNKTKKKDEEYLISKNVDYKGYRIIFWAKEDDRGPMKDTAFDVGWNTESKEAGYYHSGISAEDIVMIMERHLVESKKVIDRLIEKPDIIQKVRDLKLE